MYLQILNISFYWFSFFDIIAAEAFKIFSESSEYKDVRKPNI